MKEAVIVSTARTPIGKAFRGAFNNTHGSALAGHAIRHAIRRAEVDPAEVDDVVLGCAMPQGATGQNIARISAIAAGLPVTTAGTTIDRQCSSGLQAVSVAAHRVMLEDAPIVVAGGVESISLVQANYNTVRLRDDELMKTKPELWMPMIDTAEVVAKRYDISREEQDQYALESQVRTAQGQAQGKFDDEIVPLRATKIVSNKETGDSWKEEVELLKDEGNRPDTNAQGLANLNPVRGDGGFITAGNGGGRLRA